MVQTPALAQYMSLAEGDRITLRGDFSLEVVELRVFEKYDGVVVTDRLNEEALGIVRRRRNDDLEAGDVSKNRVQALRVLRAGTESCAEHGPYDQWRARLTPRTYNETWLLDSGSDPNRHPENRRTSVLPRVSIPSWPLRLPSRQWRFGVGVSMTRARPNSPTSPRAAPMIPSIGIVDSGTAGPARDILTDDHHP